MNALEVVAWLENLYTSYGLPIIFLSSFIEITPLGFAIPGGLMLAAGGFFAYGRPGLLLGILLAGFFGTLTTFITAYYLGHKSGNWLITKLKQEKNASYANHLLTKHGGVILTTSMLSSYIRFWIAYVAGTQKYSFIRFLFYATCASITWVAMYVVIGYLAGSERANLEKGLVMGGILGYVLVVASGLIIALSIKKEFKAYKENSNHEDN